MIINQSERGVRSVDAPLTLFMMRIETPLGTMQALADDHALYVLEFCDQKKLYSDLLCARLQAHIVPGTSSCLKLLEEQLSAYFSGTLREFTIPLHLIGTPFQQSVWFALQQIPYNTTRAYSDIAHVLGKPTAYRAVAAANGANRIEVIIPCHRVISKDGSLNGYSAGCERKKWLLQHEHVHGV